VLNKHQFSGIFRHFLDENGQNLMMGPKLTQVWLGQVKFLLLGSGRVSHLSFGFGIGKFPLKIPNFSMYALWVKKNLIWSVQKVPGSKLG